MARARQLMLTTSQSMSEIALACGLLDQAHLCRTFRKATGTTPGAWRRNHAVGPEQGMGHGTMLSTSANLANDYAW